MKKVELYRNDSVSFYDLPKPETDEEVKEYVKRFDEEFGRNFMFNPDMDPECDYYSTDNPAPSHEKLVMMRIEIMDELYDELKEAVANDDLEAIFNLHMICGGLQEGKKKNYNEFNINRERI